MPAFLWEALTSPGSHPLLGGREERSIHPWKEGRVYPYIAWLKGTGRQLEECWHSKFQQPFPQEAAMGLFGGCADNSSPFLFLEQPGEGLGYIPVPLAGI